MPLDPSDELTAWRHAADEVPEALRVAVSELQSNVDVPSAWRRSLTSAIRSEPLPIQAPPARAAHVQMRPLYAAAAAIVFTTLGALGAMVAMSGNRSNSLAVSAETPAPNVASALRVSADGTLVSVRFSVVAPGANRVSVVGAFNQWDPSANLMQRSDDGVTWTTMIAMPVGKHSYAFVIDGEVTSDPEAPVAAEDDFGVPNSFLLVSSSL
jgi:hypothetical protein